MHCSSWPHTAVCKCITLFSHLITIIDNLENLRWSKKWEKEIPLQQKETKILLWNVEWHIQIFRLSAFKIQKIDTCLEIISQTVTTFKLFLSKCTIKFVKLTHMIAWKHFSSSFEKISSINVRLMSTSCQNKNKKIVVLTLKS